MRVYLGEGTIPSASPSPPSTPISSPTRSAARGRYASSSASPSAANPRTSPPQSLGAAATHRSPALTASPVAPGQQRAPPLLPRTPTLGASPHPTRASPHKSRAYLDRSPSSPPSGRYTSLQNTSAHSPWLPSTQATPKRWKCGDASSHPLRSGHTTSPAPADLQGGSAMPYAADTATQSDLFSSGHEA